MNPSTDVALAALVALLSGSLPFAVWASRCTTGRDLREVGDGNPGAMNAFRSGGVALGLVVLLLDVSKGVLPLVFARDALALDGGALALVAVLTVAGAAFSPFLGFEGGKALAATLGTWIGWTIWTIPLVAIVAIVTATLVIEPDGWAVAAALAAMLVAVLAWGPGGGSVAALVAQAAIILWKHRSQLATRPRRRGGAPRPT
jgi:glycerol-3-phosphate acyltransferase PlsY